MAPWLGALGHVTEPSWYPIPSDTLLKSHVTVCEARIGIKVFANDK